MADEPLTIFGIPVVVCDRMPHDWVALVVADAVRELLDPDADAHDVINRAIADACIIKAIFDQEEPGNG